jgi:hypothetical protein
MLVKMLCKASIPLERKLAGADAWSERMGGLTSSILERSGRSRDTLRSQADSSGPVSKRMVCLASPLVAVIIRESPWALQQMLSMRSSVVFGPRLEGCDGFACAMCIMFPVALRLGML